MTWRALFISPCQKELVATTNSILAQIQHEFPENNDRERLIRGQVARFLNGIDDEARAAKVRWSTLF
jgi:hypothetical protein